MTKKTGPLRTPKKREVATTTKSVEMMRRMKGKFQIQTHAYYLSYLRSLDLTTTAEKKN